MKIDSEERKNKCWRFILKVHRVITSTYGSVAKTGMCTLVAGPQFETRSLGKCSIDYIELNDGNGKKEYLNAKFQCEAK